MKIYTVILSYNDGTDDTYMTSAYGDDPTDAADNARRELADEQLIRDDDDDDDRTYDDLILEKAMGYTVIAVIEGDHQDLYDHNQ